MKTNYKASGFRGRKAPSKRPRQVAWANVLLALLGLLALGSVVVGGWNAMHRSQDFQWSGSRVLDAHLDPWHEYLRGDPDHRFVLTQVPNYLPILYLLIFPLGWMSLGVAKLVWMIFNLLFAVWSAILAGRFYGLRRQWLLLVICLMLVGTPTRTSIGNGQQGLLVLFVWCLTLMWPRLSDRGAAWAGASYFKFNFAPAALFFLLFRGGVRAALLSAIPSIVATLAIWLWITGGHDSSELARLVTEPLAVSRVGYAPSGGGTNLMDVLEAALGRFHLSMTIVNPLELVSALVVCGSVLYVALRRQQESSTQWQLALMATMSFGLFKHHDYDGIVLLIPLCYGLRMWADRRGKAVVLLLGYGWYVQRAVEAAHLQPSFGFVFEFGLLVAVLVLVFKLRSYETKLEPGWQTSRAAA